ncbi:unnamed protein product, partial [Meganyctiphanes norvegica]
EDNNIILNQKEKIPYMESTPFSVDVKTIPATLIAIKIPNAELQRMQIETKQLRKENEVLRKQLSLFKQLIRNRERLDSVLRRLEEKAEEKANDNKDCKDLATSSLL